jgi:hypothetical protein
LTKYITSSIPSFEIRLTTTITKYNHHMKEERKEKKNKDMILRSNTHIYTNNDRLLEIEVVEFDIDLFEVVFHLYLIKSNPKP